MLFVHWNSSLAAYLSLIPDSEVKIASILAPVAPHALSVCTVHIGYVTSAVLCMLGVQSTKKSTRAWDLIAFLPANSIAKLLISVAHFPIRPMALGFLKILSSGKLEGIVIFYA